MVLYYDIAHDLAHQRNKAVIYNTFIPREQNGDGNIIRCQTLDRFIVIRW